jgi:hypothetical protein
MGHSETLNPDRIQIQDPDSYLILNNDSAAEPDYMSLLPYVRTSVADPGSGAILTPGSGIQDG